MKSIITAVVLAVISTAASAQECADKFMNGKAPVLTNEKLSAKTQPLCFTEFAVLHSGVTRTPLWSAEHLTRSQIEAASTMRRENVFHPETRLSPTERAELSDYARSGYDRGHMAPSGDEPDAQSQAESFSLANMVPQNPTLNRGIWEGIESAVRTLAKRDGEVWVVTGPAFRGATVQRLHGRVMVPTDTWKAIYDPHLGASAYMATNDGSGNIVTMSINHLRDITGIDPFPGLPDDVKSHDKGLPDPTPHYMHQAHAAAHSRAD